MSRERIPDAVVGSAPGLEIRQRAGRSGASEGGESAHSVALTTLSKKRLEGIPIVQGTGVNNLRYFDARGREITKKQAMAVAGGVSYYQADPASPERGQLRRHGSFCSEKDARSAIEASRAGSDVANMRDLDGHEAVRQDICTIKEEDDKKGLSHRMLMLISLMLLFLAAVLSNSGRQATWGNVSRPSVENALGSAEIATSTMVDDVGHLYGQGGSNLMVKGGWFDTMYRLWGPLDKDELSNCRVKMLQLPNNGQTSRDCQATWGHESRPIEENMLLSAEMASLLNVDETGNDELSTGLLEMLRLPYDGATSTDKQKLQAAAEIDRILASRQASDILGPGPLRRQQAEFRRITLLLHPDRGLVSSSDERASVALRLAFAARRRVLASN